MHAARHVDQSKKSCMVSYSYKCSGSVPIAMVLRSVVLGMETPELRYDAIV